MHLNRTRFAKDIVCEYLAPVKKTKKVKVVIFCPGAPGTPFGKSDYALAFAKKGYWFFYLRYRGSWESGGEFLKISPHLDVLDVINGLAKGFNDSYSLEKIKLIPQEVILIGGSFGGPAVILNSKDPRVTKVIANSPVIDWSYPVEEEPLDILNDLTKRAYGEGYRLCKKGWNKLASGKFYDPSNSIDQIDASKILILQAKDDKICPPVPAIRFAKKTGAKIKLYKKGGHVLPLLKPNISKVVFDFLKS